MCSDVLTRLIPCLRFAAGFFVLCRFMPIIADNCLFFNVCRERRIEITVCYVLELMLQGYLLLGGTVPCVNIYIVVAVGILTGEGIDGEG